MFHAWLDSGFIEVSGEDRSDFVHGLLTCDVRSLTDGQGTGGLLLNHRGHALAQLTVIRLDGLLLLAVEDGLADHVYQELDRHIIFDQVSLRKADGDWLQLTVQGAGADSLAGLLPAVASVPAARSPAGGSDLFVRGTQEEADGILLQAGSTAYSREQLDAARVAGLAPLAASEAGEGVLPQEAGLEHLVSYRKGCYLGQEIMARIEARGRLRRGLRRLVLSGDPGLERDIRLDGRTVGRLGTVAAGPAGDSLALAVLRLDLPEDAVLEVGGASARLDG